MPAPGRVEPDTRSADWLPPGITLRSRLSQVFSANELFVYENPTGERDVATYVGFGTVLRLELWGDRIEVSGKPGVVERVDALLQETHRPLGTRHRADSWSLLDDVMALFGAAGNSERFEFGAFCYFGYAATHRSEQVPRRHAGSTRLPDVSLTICEGHIEVDGDGRGRATVYRSPWWTPTLTSSQEVLQRLSAGNPPAVDDLAQESSSAPRDEMSREQYHRRTSTCLDAIKAGEVYQVQLGHAISVRTSRDPSTVYSELIRANPSPHTFFWPIRDAMLLGASPESLLQIRGSVMTMRPIAGTCRVVGDPRADRRAQDEMRSDPKELSEHLMLVDLCRNDLARVAVPGTVRVPEYLVVEQYSHVAHLVSAVTAEPATGIGGFELLRAVYPAGTMTGAPKLRAMEIIDDLEISDRGAYAGAVALVGCGGFVDSALSIRALTHDGSVFTARASAGIVAESDPDSEWEETLAKMAGPLSTLTPSGGAS